MFLAESPGEDEPSAPHRRIKPESFPELIGQTKVRHIKTRLLAHEFTSRYGEPQREIGVFRDADAGAGCDFERLDVAAIANYQRTLSDVGAVQRARDAERDGEFPRARRQIAQALRTRPANLH